MKNNINLFITLALFTICFYSCAAIQMGGELIRGDKKEFDVTMGPGITHNEVQSLNNIVIAVNGLNSSGQVVFGTYSGSTNANVYTDMFTMQLMKKGVLVSTLSEGTADVFKQQDFTSLAEKGYNMVFIINTNFSASTTVTDAVTGGEWAKLGVTSFTMKGIRISDNKLLFIGSGNYGKSKDAGQVAKDVAFVFGNIMKGTLQNLQNPE